MVLAVLLGVRARRPRAIAPLDDNVPGASSYRTRIPPGGTSGPAPRENSVPPSTAPTTVAGPPQAPITLPPATPSNGQVRARVRVAAIDPVAGTVAVADAASG